jgi:Domain of unknown function (DUF4249)
LNQGRYQKLTLIIKLRISSFYTAIILALSFLGSCINPLELSINEELNLLIVEGAITTRSGSQWIRLTRSDKFGSIFDGYIRPVQRAKVRIRDSDGNNFELSERIDTWFELIGTPFGIDTINYSASTGFYYTEDNFSAEVGKSYTLLITTANGTQYSSLPEKVIKVPEILELSAEFSKIQIKKNSFKTGLEVYASFQDPLEEQNFYMWKNTGTYHLVTYPELYIRRGLYTGPVQYAPKDCCRDCWVNETPDRLTRLLNDYNINGNSVTTSVAFITDDSVRFADKYLIRIEQYGLTREAFQFFKLLKEQISIDGDIFDPPPATLRGNMINLQNPDENVIGYFRASDVRIDSMFLTRDMLLEPHDLKVIGDDCREIRKGTTQRPSYW